MHTANQRRKTAVSFVIRDAEECYNRSGVNCVLVDPSAKLLYSGGRDAIVRCWNIGQAGAGQEPVSRRQCHGILLYKIINTQSCTGKCAPALGSLE